MIYIFFAFFNCLLDRVHTKNSQLRQYFLLFSQNSITSPFSHSTCGNFFVPRIPKHLFLPQHSLQRHLAIFFVAKTEQAHFSIFHEKYKACAWRQGSRSGMAASGEGDSALIFAGNVV